MVATRRSMRRMAVPPVEPPGLSGKVAVKHIETQIIHVEQSGELVQSHFVREVSSVII